MPLQHLRDVAKALRKLQRNNNNATTKQSTTKKQQEQQQQEPTQQRDYSYNVGASDIAATGTTNPGCVMTHQENTPRVTTSEHLRIRG